MKIKKWLLPVIALLIALPNIVSAQGKPNLHVSWTYTVKPLTDCEFDLVFTATIEKNWHLYSQIAVTDGPLPTVFMFDASPNYKLIGKTSEPKPIEKEEPVFGPGIIIKYFEDKAVFHQKIKAVSDKPFKVTGAIDGMACSDMQCVNFFPYPTFSFDIPGCTGGTSEVIDPATAKSDSAAWKAQQDSIRIVREDSARRADSIKKTAGTPQDSNDNPGGTLKQGDSIWTAFGGGFAGGLLALLTPCVFPMIPMTVSFFTKRAKSRSKGIRDALIYAFSIIAIYVSLGMLVTLATGNPQTLNQLSANIWFNLLFFAVFVVFGVSFLGAFEITLPSTFVNRMDRASDKGGLLGIFFMAFTLSLVSFSCTGPVVGTALVEAIKAGPTGPLFVMLGFSIALALPFALFAMFPGWLNSLPKSGGWLNSVKVVMGLLEFALALKFLSNVDLSYHWGIITREIFIAIWIVCFSLIGFYLLGKIKFSHDSDVPHVSVPRAVFAIFTFAFVVYLIPGMWGAPVRMLSGILPPSYYSENVEMFSGGGSTMTSNGEELPEGIDPAHCPLNLNCFHDYDLALAYAKKMGKPLFVDFTGYNCANCRRMEDNVWPDPSVKKQLESDYILVSLYCDDKAELPEHLKYTTEGGVKIETWGHKWSQMQIDRYGLNGQPTYVLLDHDEKPLHEPIPYTPAIEEYAKLLKDGVTKFNTKHGK